MDLMFANILERQIDYLKVDKDFKRVVRGEDQGGEKIDYDQAYILIRCAFYFELEDFL